MLLALAGFLFSIFLLLLILMISKSVASKYKKLSFFYSVLFLILFFISINSHLNQKGIKLFSYLSLDNKKTHVYSVTLNSEEYH
ncbi:hypothetical protein ACTWQB_16780 [Piscibacillus sp. B03]|uniref:hypothetical protein n=1 Tax=Piscibacillus sp. B03 TaxID=3457430 RepID=UPI003FCE0416